MAYREVLVASLQLYFFQNGTIIVNFVLIKKYFMKNKFLLATVVFLCICIQASYGISRTKNKKQRASSEESLKFIGIQSGYKSPLGALGVYYAIPVNEKTYIRPGAGIGLFAYKVGVDAQVFSKPNHSGFAFGGGFGYCAMRGGSGSTVAEFENTNSGITSYYNLHVNNALLINANIGYHFAISNKSRFFIQSGVCIPHTPTLSATNINTPQDDFSAVQLANTLISPTGLNILTLGFAFGF
jgi:hypothetical protein